MGAWSGARAWARDHVFEVDTMAAAAVGLFVVPLAMTGAVQLPGPGQPSRLAALATLVMVAAMAWRRTRPVASTAIVYSAALIRIMLGVPMVLPGDLVVAWSLWSITLHGPPRWARAALVCAMVGSAVVGIATGSTGGEALAFAAVSALVLLTAWSSAQALRNRRQTLAALQDRALRLEVERDQQASLAAAAERARIAREMHDIVAHSLTVIVAQADGGRYAGAANPGAATAALETIAATGRAALQDVRRLLGVLREGGPAAAEVAPLPGESDLAALVARLRAGGLHVDVQEQGSPRELPAGIGLTVYRIAQEALTNVLKHAGPCARAQLSVRWLPDRIEVEVVDDGRGAAVSGDGRGQGLAGMAERAALYGGHLTAGPRAGGGFAVLAELPTGPGRVPR
jgi:signal transduction histidine kinase